MASPEEISETSSSASSEDESEIRSHLINNPNILSRYEDYSDESYCLGYLVPGRLLLNRLS
jgi:hypothetical protein